MAEDKGPDTGPDATWRRNAFDPAWAEEVSAWKWVDWEEGKPPREGMKASGSCPRCTHPITFYSADLHFFMPPESPVYVPVGCNCGEGHKGRPEDDKYKGCGFRLELEAPQWPTES